MSPRPLFSLFGMFTLECICIFLQKQLNVSLGCVENLFYFVSVYLQHFSTVPFLFFSKHLFLPVYWDIYLLAECKFMYNAII